MMAPWQSEINDTQENDIKHSNKNQTDGSYDGAMTYREMKLRKRTLSIAIRTNQISKQDHMMALQQLA